MKEPCASLVLMTNTPTRPAASSAETSNTNGARGGAFRGRTTRSVVGRLTGALGGDVLTGAVVAGAIRTPSIATSDAVASDAVASVTGASMNGSALTRLPESARSRAAAPTRPADWRRSHRHSPDRHRG